MYHLSSPQDAMIPFGIVTEPVVQENEEGEEIEMEIPKTPQKPI